MSVKDSDGIEGGVITSVTFSPTLKNGVALALLDSSVSLGTMVVIDVRGRESQAEVVTLPFVESHVR
jgi:aminomethyltransferase